ATGTKIISSPELTLNISLNSGIIPYLIATIVGIPSIATRANILPILPNRWIESRSEEHTSELQSRFDLVCRLLLEKKKNNHLNHDSHGSEREGHQNSSHTEHLRTSAISQLSSF